MTHLRRESYDPDLNGTLTVEGIRGGPIRDAPLVGPRPFA